MNGSGFRGRSDVEGGTLSYPIDRRPRINGGGRSVIMAPNPMAFLGTMMILFMILNASQSPTFLLWLAMVIFLLVTCLRMIATWQQIRAQMHLQGALATALVPPGSSGGHEIRLRFNPAPTSLLPTNLRATTGGGGSRLHSLGLQLALLNRDLTEADYEALRALDSDNPRGVDALSDVDINRLPTYVVGGYGKKGNNEEGGEIRSDATNSESRAEVLQKQNEVRSWEGKKVEDCSVCLEQVVDGDIMRTLPCLHQFHANCVDQWLSQQATCPVCKYRLVTTASRQNVRHPSQGESRIDM